MKSNKREQKEERKEEIKKRKEGIGIAGPSPIPMNRK
jgi:hypothetical protein